MPSSQNRRDDHLKLPNSQISNPPRRHDPAVHPKVYYNSQVGSKHKPHIKRQPTSLALPFFTQPDQPHPNPMSRKLNSHNPAAGIVTTPPPSGKMTMEKPTDNNKNDLKHTPSRPHILGIHGMYQAKPQTLGPVPVQSISSPIPPPAQPSPAQAAKIKRCNSTYVDKTKPFSLHPSRQPAPIRPSLQVIQPSKSAVD